MSKSKAVAALAMQARKLGYPVELREPILRVSLPYLGPLSGVAKPETDNVKGEFIAKMELLCNHYGIHLRLSDAENSEAVQMLLLLAQRLASDWVPGFHIVEPRKRGPKPKRTKLAQANDALAVFFEVERQRLKGVDKKILSACREFKRLSRDKRRVSTLRNVYMTGRKINAMNKKIAGGSLLQTLLDDQWFAKSPK